MATKSCQLLSFNIQASTKITFHASYSLFFNNKKNLGVATTLQAKPVGDQMKPIRPSEFHRQGWQHIGQINHTNTCLQTSFLEARAKRKTKFG